MLILLPNIKHTKFNKNMSKGQDNTFNLIVLNLQTGVKPVFWEL